VEPAGLASRAGELGLSAAEFEELHAQLSGGVMAAVLAALIRFEDALADLASMSADNGLGAKA
jgi:hypothetical protein